jgi:hypothetical protein
MQLLEEVVEAGMERARDVLRELKEGESKDRLSALRAVTAFLEAVGGKRTVVQHLHSGSEVPGDESVGV